MRILLVALILSTSMAGAEEWEYIELFEPWSDLPAISSENGEDELRIYEVDLFGNNAIAIYRIFLAEDLRYFRLPRPKNYGVVKKAFVKEFIAPALFEQVFPFTEWEIPYEYIVDDGVEYLIQYRWKGEHGSFVLNNPAYTANTDAQLFVRIINELYSYGVSPQPVGACRSSPEGVR